MASTGRRIVVLILIVSLTAPMVAAPAAASHDCSTVNKGTWLAFAGLSAIGEAQDGSGVGCDMIHEETAVQEVREAETAQDKVDLYSAASAQSQSDENWGTTYDNYLQDTESIAWQKAEAAIAEAYENGATKAEAKVAAKEAIANYYSTKQKNLLDNWNTTALAYAYIHERAVQEGFSEGGFVYFEHNPDSNYDYGQPYLDDTTNVSVQLVNGNSTATVAVTANTTSGYQLGGSNGGRIHPADPQTNYSPGGLQYGTDMIGMNVSAPNSNYDELSVVRFNPYINRWSQIESKNTELQNESDAFVDATWQDYQDGNINSTDVLSRTTTMFEYGTSSISGNGTYYDMIGAAAGMGLETPNLDGTGQMQVTIPDANNTYDGLVFARNAPGGQWEAGKTYDPANISGPVMLGTVDGHMMELNRKFTIDSITDKSGTEQASAQTTSYNYQTANTSDLLSKYDRLLNLTMELQERSNSAGTSGGGGSGSSGSSISPTMGLIGAVLALLGLLLYSTESSSRRGGGRY